MARICKKCNQSFELSEFYKNRAEKDGLMPICKYCKKIQARESNQRCQPHTREKVKLYKKEYYKKNKDQILLKCRDNYLKNIDNRKKYTANYKKENAAKVNLYTREYIKNNLRQYVRTTYLAMKSRCYNPKNSSYSNYGAKGVQVLVEKEEFIEWSLSNPSFLLLHKEYILANYKQALAPSIDRIDPMKSYSFDNMQWITMSENSSRK